MKQRVAAAEASSERAEKQAAHRLSLQVSTVPLLRKPGTQNTVKARFWPFRFLRELRCGAYSYLILIAFWLS